MLSAPGDMPLEKCISSVEVNKYFPQGVAVFIVFVLIFLMYISVAAATTLGPKWYVFDFVERFRIFGVDEAYRFYFSKAAWSNPALYSWSYILPVGLVFDGIVSLISAGNLFAVRCIHIAVNVSGLALLYCAGLRVGVSRYVMIFSVLIAALMPLYALVSMSVLGESWLIFFVCLMIYFFFHEKWRSCAFTVALMPLIRAEGIFFVLPMLVFFLAKRDRWSAVLLVSPGLLYLLYLFISLDSIFAYINWRLALRQVLNIITNPLAFRVGVLGTFNPVWLLPALGAFFMRDMRKFWPLWVGALIVLLWFVVLLLLRLVNYEPRYLLFIMPVCVISWAILVQSCLRLRALEDIKAGMIFLLCGVTLFVVFDNLLQVDALRTIYGAGKRWPVKGISPRQVSFGFYEQDHVNQRKEIVRNIYEALEGNSSIRALMIFNPEIFMDLDPRRIPESVKVVLLQMDNDTANKISDGKMLGLFPEGDQFSFFIVDKVTEFYAANGIYAGQMNCVSCRPLVRVGGFALYSVSYHESLLPNGL
ncbi:MAG: hypothetical protein PSX71_13475 [bacterium]|nr:hypothetical protein [bacterium]